MNMVLRPGEAIVWRWGQWNPVKHHGALYTMPAYTHTIYNGLWEYRPDLSKPSWRQGTTMVEHVRPGKDGLTLVAKLGPQFEVLATNKLDDGIIASPVVVGTDLFIRGYKSLYCIAEK